MELNAADSGNMLQLRHSLRDTREIHAIQKGNDRSHLSRPVPLGRDSDEGNRDG